MKYKSDKDKLTTENFVIPFFSSNSETPSFKLSNIDFSKIEKLGPQKSFEVSRGEENYLRKTILFVKPNNFPNTILGSIFLKVLSEIKTNETDLV